MQNLFLLIAPLLFNTLSNLLHNIPLVLISSDIKGLLRVHIRQLVQVLSGGL